MLKVALRQARFNAPIGMYPQEQLIYNDIEVDVILSQQTHLEALPFINYVALYQIVKSVIEKHHPTLEAIVQEIINTIHETYQAATIEVAVRKLHPPVGGPVACSEVSYTFEPK